MIKILLRALRWLAILAVLVTSGLALAVIVAGYWPGSTSPLFDLEFVLAPWVVMALLPTTVIAFLYRWRYLRWSMLTMTLILGLPYLPYFLPRSISPASTGLHVKLLTFNTWGTKRVADAEQIAYLIYSEQPDIVTLQEVTEARLKRIQTMLQVLAPNKPMIAVTNLDTDQVILSRFPITKLEQDSSASQFLSARVRTPLGDVVVWNVHAYRENFLAAFSERNILSYSNLADHRDGIAQFEWLNERITQVKQPLLIAGDFNVAPFSREYSLLTQHTQDAFAEAGWGFGFTFPATRAQALQAHVRGRSVRLSTPWPIAQIDHIFHGAHFSTVKATVLPTTAGSDHRPVLAEFSLIE